MPYLSADVLNAAIARLKRPRYADGALLEDGAGGRRLSFREPQGFWARIDTILSGVGYLFTEVRQVTPAGVPIWETHPNPRRGLAFEVNRRIDVPTTQVVWMRPGWQVPAGDTTLDIETSEEDYRFVWCCDQGGVLYYGASPPPVILHCCDIDEFGDPAVTLCATITDLGDCNSGLDGFTTPMSFDGSQWNGDDVPFTMVCADFNLGTYEFDFSAGCSTGNFRGVGTLESCDPFFLSVILTTTDGCTDICGIGSSNPLLMIEVYEC